MSEVNAVYYFERGGQRYGVCRVPEIPGEFCVYVRVPGGQDTPAEIKSAWQLEVEAPVGSIITVAPVGRSRGSATPVRWLLTEAEGLQPA